MNKNPLKNILITGASRGIGKVLAYEYSSKGANLVLLARDENALQNISADLNEHGGNVFYKKCDVSDRKQMKESVDFAVNSLRSIDAAILNAGMSIKNWMDGFSADNFEQTLEVNLFSIAYGLEFLVPVMKRQGYGTIAGVSSLADARGYPGSGAYSASKAAVTKLLESARVELSSNNIKVIIIKPGFVRTDMTAKNEFRMPFLMDAGKAANVIRKGIERNRKVIQFPLGTVLLSKVAALMPNFVYDPVLRWLRPKKDS